MTHSHFPHIHTCPRCRSMYTVTSERLPILNARSVECQVCGNELIPPSAVRIWAAELIRQGEWPPRAAARPAPAADSPAGERPRSVVARPLRPDEPGE